MNTRLAGSYLGLGLLCGGPALILCLHGPATRPAAARPLPAVRKPVTSPGFTDVTTTIADSCRVRV